MSASAKNPAKALEGLVVQAESQFQAANSMEALEAIRLAYFGKKGVFAEHSKSLKSLAQDDKKTFGKAMNDAKESVLSLWKRRREKVLGSGGLAAPTGAEDFNLPGRHRQIGMVHPLQQAQDEVLNLLNAMGFATVEGPEIETEYYNFDALNMPPGHPARASQDSLYLKPGFLLRTQTSPIQIRVMERTKNLPLSIVAPGRVFRRDSIDATHTPIFHQIEGLHLNKNVAFSDLKGVLTTFCRRLFGSTIPIRFKPDYFPFTEPSCEIAIRFEGEWMEILGAGMVNPKILQRVGLDPETYSGLAFGLGVERIAMIKYQIKDIRLFYDNDFRFIEQFN